VACPEPILISLKRNAVIEFCSLKIHFLDAVGRQPTPQVIGLIDGQLRELDDSFSFDNQGYQFDHSFIVFLQMKWNPSKKRLIINYDCVNFNIYFSI